MIEAIAQVGVEQAAATAAAGSTAAGAGAAQGPANAYDVAHFRSLYAQSQAEAQPASAVGGLPEGVQVAATTASEPSAGMRQALSFFESLNGRASDVGLRSEEIMARQGDYSPSDLLDLTMRAQHFMFQATLTSNVANRTSDGVQQLFRQQG
ncbi:hypothetical protein [Coralloluteibacterium stylophorae]|uniref:Type III secretion protein n=1 Tax=Coralloluteibacterium stylophorae TaxID=1776034 RepID=A0A8J7VT18_9GAMM|nr:hypothetical protein [Coralloluteibacterium stylophorae]MBS7458775.1 hypothetical protein [Coralloluteibacterium stylophorae]